MSLQFQQPSNEIKSAKEIAHKINSYYNELSNRKELHNLIREVAEDNVLQNTIKEYLEDDFYELKELLETGQITEEEAEEKMEELKEKAKIHIEDDFVYDDVKIKYKKRVSWAWKKEFDEILDDLGRLPECKNVVKSDEVRYNIADFRLPKSKYIKIYNHLNESKEEKAIRLEEEKEMTCQNKKKLQLKSMDELILLFKENKDKLSKLEVQYEKDRKELFDAMIEENINEVFANDDETSSFKMHEKANGYDNNRIYVAEIEKKFFFIFKELGDGKMQCKDWFTGDVFTLVNEKETEHDGHSISFKDGTIWVDHEPLYSPSAEELSFVKKKEMKEILKDRIHMAYGILQIDGADFLKRCKTSSTKVEKLIDKNGIEPSVMKEYRYITNEQDVSLVFEMIQEESDNERRSFFFQKLTDRSERHRIQQEQLRKNLEEVL